MTCLFLFAAMLSDANAQSAAEMMAAAKPDLPKLQIELVADGAAKSAAKGALPDLEKRLAQHWQDLDGNLNALIATQEKIVAGAKGSKDTEQEHADGNVALLMQARASLANGPPKYRVEIASGMVILVEQIPAVPWASVSPQRIDHGKPCPDVGRLNQLLDEVAEFRSTVGDALPPGQNGAMLEIGSKEGPAILGVVQNGKFGGSVRVNGSLTKYDYNASCHFPTGDDAKQLKAFFDAARSVRKSK